MKKLLALLLVICLAVSVMPSVHADNENTGSFGSGFSYFYDKGTGTLLIKGTGRLPDLNELGGVTPWAAVRNGILRLIIDKGITAIPAGLFNDLPNLASVVLPAAIGEIDTDAFIGCDGITTVEVIGTPEEAKAVEEKLKAEGITVLNKAEVIAVSPEAIAKEEAAVVEAAEKDGKAAAGWEAPPKQPEGPELISEDAEYDDQGRLIKLTQEYDNGDIVETVFRYDENGGIKEKTTTIYTPDLTVTVITETPTEYMRDETQYNEDEQPLFEKTYSRSQDGSTSYMEETFTYDENGRCVSSVTVYNDYDPNETDSQGRPDPYTNGTITTTYDLETGNRKHVDEEYESTLERGVFAFECDADGNLSSSTGTIVDKETGETCDVYIEFDEDQNITYVKETVSSPDGTKTVITEDSRYGFNSSEETQYNADGLPVYEKSHFDIPDSDYYYDSETVSNYDGDRNLISTIETYDSYTPGLTDNEGRPNPAQKGTTTKSYNPETGLLVRTEEEFESTLFTGNATFDYNAEEINIASTYTTYDKETGDKKTYSTECYDDGSFSLEREEKTDAATGYTTVTTKTYNRDGTYIETVVVYDENGKIVGNPGSPVPKDPGVLS